MNKKILKISSALIAVIVAGVIFCYLHAHNNRPVIEDVRVDGVNAAGSEDIYAPQEEDSLEDDDYIWVYVCGAVNDPGVFLLNEGSRVFEAVELAGGFTDDAVRDAVNLALVLEDGQQVFIPDISGTLSQAYEEPDDGLININTATIDQLITLPGIGQAKALAIIEYRESHPFGSIDEIMNVSGIKENSFNRIKDRIKV